jgi:integrase
MTRRSYGTGSLFVRRDARGREYWYGQWWAGNRRPKRKLGPKRPPGSRDGLTRGQAERALRQLIERESAAAQATPERRLSLTDLGGRYVDHREQVMERKRTTIQDYRIILSRHLTPFFADKAIERISPGDIEAYMHAKRREGLATKTIQNQLAFLNAVFVFAIKRGWANSNPVAHVERPRKTQGSKRRLRFLQPAELDALVRNVPDDALGHVERVLYLCAAMTGLRQGELLGLRWADIDWTAGRVRVADNFTRGQIDSPKSHDGRSVPMADRVAGELERLHQRSRFQADSDLVLCHPHTGNPLDPSKLRKRFKRALKRAAAPEITFHELRHTFGTQLAAAGIPLRTIQEWMGHADAKTTEIYSHYAPDPTRGADLIEGAFDAGGAHCKAGNDNSGTDRALPLDAVD